MLYHGANAQDKKSTSRHAPTGMVQYGTASYYGGKFNGRKTANGEKFDQKKMTAAHNGLPLNTYVKVTNLRNKKTVVVKITDRMHPKNKRLIDLSRGAAEKLGYVGQGLTKVKVEVVSNSPTYSQVKK
ncbi:MAG: septal ring lytic transglycosylase RlpA family lipoprotein [Bacteroidetes bacterium]|nr:MAG: septal ring lytic transglycosylase RlpA family lipoprotein [Bacteroidota bacterium]